MPDNPNPLTLLDCTLRDGGYYTNWQFSSVFVQEYLSICQNLDIDIIELGYMHPSTHLHKGGVYAQLPCHLPKEISQTISMMKGTQFAVMIDAKNWFNLPDEMILEDFENLSALPIKNVIVRVALHYSMIRNFERLHHLLNLKKIPYMINVMQVDVATPLEIRELVKQLNTYENIQAVYLADSLGSITPDKVKSLAHELLGHIPAPLGFHAHDNQGLALHNSLIAIEHGFTFIDSTLYGMGRGAGNTKTEQLRSCIKNGLNSNTFKSTSEFIAKQMESLHQIHQWGTSSSYALAGFCKIHPTYVQHLNSKQYSSEKIQAILIRLSAESASNYNPALLDKIMEEQPYEFV